MSAGGTAVTTLVLHGEVAGNPRSYLLGTGLNRIGSRLTGDVVLAHPSVSRRHALLMVEPAALGLEDLGSKNGSFVNGRRVESARLCLGDELRFGSVRLRLERLTTEEATLAFALAPPRGGRASAAAEGDSTALAEGAGLPGGGPGAGAQPGSDQELARRTAWLEAIAEAIPAAGRGELAPALAVLARTTGGDGAALLEARGGEVVVLACAGLLASESTLTAVLAPGPAADGTTLSARLDGSTAGRALVIWGTATDAAAGAWLPLVLRLFDRALPAPLQPPEAASRPLVVPAGWVVGRSPAMRHLLQQVASLAAAELPVLILGDTGVGKEGVARLLHGSSRRRHGPFVALNCAAIPRDLLEAELFGVGRGAATGVRERAGTFAQAAGGTLLLDEVGELPAELQAKLLRALQEGEVQPLGAGARRTDVRVLAATNAALEERVAAGTFRQDLFFRLAGAVLRVPCLAERREDIPALVEHFLALASREAGKAIRGISVAALAQLVEHPWPGNVRQLENLVRRLVWLSAGSEVVVPASLVAAGLQAPASGDPAPPATPLDLAALERRAVEEALRRAAGSPTRAAALLGITRPSLYRRLERYGLRRSAH